MMAGAAAKDAKELSRLAYCIQSRIQRKIEQLKVDSGFVGSSTVKVVTIASRYHDRTGSNHGDCCWAELACPQKPVAAPGLLPHNQYDVSQVSHRPLLILCKYLHDSAGTLSSF
jgi:hypothetical protein